MCKEIGSLECMMLLNCNDFRQTIFDDILLMIFKVVYSKAMQFHSFGLISQLWRIFEDQTKMEIPIWDFAALNKLNKYFHGKTVKYTGPILRVTCPALGSNDLNLDRRVFKFCRSLTLVTWHVFFVKLQLYTLKHWQLKFWMDQNWCDFVPNWF